MLAPRREAQRLVRDQAEEYGHEHDEVFIEESLEKKKERVSSSCRCTVFRIVMEQTWLLSAAQFVESRM